MLDILYALRHLILTPCDVYYYSHFRDEVTKAYSSVKTCLQHCISGPPQFNLHSKYLLSPLSSKPRFPSNWFTTPPDMSSSPHLYVGCISQIQTRSPTTQVQSPLKTLQTWLQAQCYCVKHSLLRIKLWTQLTHWTWPLKPVKPLQLRLRG